MRKYTMKFAWQEVTDTITGELLRINSFKIQKKEYDKYMKLYHENLKDIDFTPTELKLLLFLDANKQFNNSEIYINKALLDKFSTQDKVNINSAYTAIKGLREKKLLLKMDNGREFLNPVYSWSGYENDREKALKELKDVIAKEPEVPYNKTLKPNSTYNE